jgi:hypothetical protein
MTENLARRLRADTRGEVLFDAASRGRYATDASIYQIMPVGVFVPRDNASRATSFRLVPRCRASLRSARSNIAGMFRIVYCMHIL